MDSTQNDDEVPEDDLSIWEMRRRSKAKAKWEQDPLDTALLISGYWVGPEGVVDADEHGPDAVLTGGDDIDRGGLDADQQDNSQDDSSGENSDGNDSHDDSSDDNSGGDDNSGDDWSGLRERLRQLDRDYRRRQRSGHLREASGSPAGSHDEKSDQGGGRDASDWVDDALDKHFEEIRENRQEKSEALKQSRKQSGDGLSWKQVNIQAFLGNEHERKEEEWGTDYPGVEMCQSTGKTPTSEEFLSHAQGGLPEALFVNADRFLALRRDEVSDITEGVHGGLTYGDTANMEVAIVSYLAGLEREQPSGRRTIEYDHGETVEVASGEIVVSMQKVARALYQRFYFQPTPRGSTTADGDFHAFYRTVTNAFGRLANTPVLDHNGPAIETGDRTSDAYGQRYSVNIPAIAQLPLCSSTPPVLFQCQSQQPPAGSYDERFVDGYSLELEDGTEVVDVAAMYDRLVATHTDQWSTFTEQAAKSTTASNDSRENFRTRETGVKGFDWQRRQARPSTVDRDDDKENSRHVTTGAFKPECSTDTERKHLPCTVPFVVLEIDGETPQLCLEYARRILRWLGSIDVPLESVTVTYTGNQSFHVRLPAGLFGKPIFRSSREATKTLRELYGLIEDKIDQLGGAHVDGALASPLHHIRAIGSVHEGRYAAENKTRYCVGFTGEEILTYPLNAIREFASRYDGYTLPRPGKAPLNGNLQDLLREACTLSQQVYETDDDRSTSRGIVDKIRREGVQEGEEFGDGMVGRNLAARLVSLHLLQSGCSDQDAWLALQDWNEKNSPPIGEAPGDYPTELRYVFEKAQEDAPRL
jgi:hypothetical protein